MSVRKSCVAGAFYPNSKEEVLRYIEHFNKAKIKFDNFDKVKAIIVPHAGYVYSGFTANLAYKIASKSSFERVVVIGVSHKVYFKGASVTLHDEFETPLGNLQIDKEFSMSLIDEFDFLGFNFECEFEHSTETQAPFIKHYFSNAKFVEIIYSDISYESLEKVIDYILKQDSTLLCISTDLSHFYSEEEAKKLDNICLNAILKRNISLFNSCEACGKTGLQAIIYHSIKNSLNTKILHYCTSADFSKDKSRVVGYTSALVGDF